VIISSPATIKRFISRYYEEKINCFLSQWSLRQGKQQGPLLMVKDFFFICYCFSDANFRLGFFKIVFKLSVFWFRINFFWSIFLIVFVLFLFFFLVSGVKSFWCNMTATKVVAAATAEGRNALEIFPPTICC